MTSRVYFVECAGNSGPNTVNPKPPQATAQAIHWLVSCSEWTGVPLAMLLNEAGIEAGDAQNRKLCPEWFGFFSEGFSVVPNLGRRD